MSLRVSTPAPAAPTPTRPAPKPTDAATTAALMVSLEVADRPRAPEACTDVLARNAWTDPWPPRPLLIVLCAIEAPIATPTPTVPPATLAATAPTIASISDASLAETVTAPT